MVGYIKIPSGDSFQSPSVARMHPGPDRRYVLLKAILMMREGMDKDGGDSFVEKVRGFNYQWRMLEYSLWSLRTACRSMIRPRCCLWIDWGRHRHQHNKRRVLDFFLPISIVLIILSIVLML